MMGEDESGDDEETVVDSQPDSHDHDHDGEQGEGETEGQDMTPLPKLHSLVPRARGRGGGFAVFTRNNTDKASTQTRGDNSKLDENEEEESYALDLVEGENWLRLTIVTDDDVNDGSQAFCSQEDEEDEDAKQTQPTPTQKRHLAEATTMRKKTASATDATDATATKPPPLPSKKQSSIHVSVWSVAELGYIPNVPSEDCFLCLDVDGSHLSIKDMRWPLDDDEEEDAYTETTQEPTHKTPGRQSPGTWQIHLGRHRKSTWMLPSSLPPLPRRQMRLLHPSDTISISIAQQQPHPASNEPCSSSLSLPPLRLLLEYRYEAVIRTTPQLNMTQESSLGLHPSSFPTTSRILASATAATSARTTNGVQSSPHGNSNPLSYTTQEQQPSSGEVLLQTQEVESDDDDDDDDEEKDDGTRASTQKALAKEAAAPDAPDTKKAHKQHKSEPPLAQSLETLRDDEDDHANANDDDDDNNHSVQQEKVAKDNNNNDKDDDDALQDPRTRTAEQPILSPLASQPDPDETDDDDETEVEHELDMPCAPQHKTGSAATTTKKRDANATAVSHDGKKEALDDNNDKHAKKSPGATAASKEKPRRDNPLDLKPLSQEDEETDVEEDPSDHHEAHRRVETTTGVNKDDETVVDSTTNADGSKKNSPRVGSNSEEPIEHNKPCQKKEADKDRKNCVADETSPRGSGGGISRLDGNNEHGTGESAAGKNHQGDRNKRTDHPGDDAMSDGIIPQNDDSTVDPDEVTQDDLERDTKVKATTGERKGSVEKNEITLPSANTRASSQYSDTLVAETQSQERCKVRAVRAQGNVRVDSNPQDDDDQEHDQEPSKPVMNEKNDETLCKKVAAEVDANHSHTSDPPRPESQESLVENGGARNNVAGRSRKDTVRISDDVETASADETSVVAQGSQERGMYNGLSTVLRAAEAVPMMPTASQVDACTLLADLKVGSPTHLMESMKEETPQYTLESTESTQTRSSRRSARKRKGRQPEEDEVSSSIPSTIATNKPNNNNKRPAPAKTNLRATNKKRKLSATKKQDNKTLFQDEEGGEASDSVSKPRILITSLIVTQVEKNMIKKIGGILLENINVAHSATHIIASNGEGSLRRTPKLMIGMCRTANIVSRDWLVKSAAARKALPRANFLILDDREAEKRYKFRMRQTLERIENHIESGTSVLMGWSVYVCRGVCGKNAPNEEEMKLIVRAAGGKWISALSDIGNDPVDRFLIITSDPEKKRQITKEVAGFIQKGAVKQPTTWLFDALMAQELPT